MQNLSDTFGKDQYAGNFDPARFQLIQYLCERVGSPGHSQNKFLAEKAKTSIEQYQADLSDGRRKASATLNKVLLNFPSQKERAQTLFDQCKFKQLQQLSVRLVASQKIKRTTSELVCLVDEMQLDLVSEEELDSTQTLEELMLKQEQQARSQVGAELFTGNERSNEQLELHSLKTARESMKYFNIDKSIERAIEDFPENAGPHNPHMLAITSLMNMRDLSPQYLRRFAGYIETVLWLEKNEVKLNRKK